MAAPKHGTGPIGIQETAGKRAYCTCGLSATLPHCDGSHARENTGLKPVVCEATAGEVWICQCHRTKTPPFCDGSHKLPPGQPA